MIAKPNLAALKKTLDEIRATLLGAESLKKFDSRFAVMNFGIRFK